MKKITVKLELPDVFVSIAENESQAMEMSLDEYFSKMIRTTMRTVYSISTAKELLEND